MFTREAGTTGIQEGFWTKRTGILGNDVFVLTPKAEKYFVYFGPDINQELSAQGKTPLKAYVVDVTGIANNGSMEKEKLVEFECDWKVDDMPSEVQGLLKARPPGLDAHSCTSFDHTLLSSSIRKTSEC